MNDINVEQECPLLDMVPISHSGRGLNNPRCEVEDHDASNDDVKMKLVVPQNEFKTDREEKWEGRKQAGVGSLSGGK